MMMSVITGAQVLKVMSFRLATNDISAVKYQRLDLNGNPCALIKVGLGVQGAKFPGTEVVGDLKFDTGEYWVYVVDGTKKLKVMHNDYTPLYIDFSNYPEQRLEGGRTYVMLLDGAKSDGGNGSSSQQQQSNFLIMSVNPPNASVTIDDVHEPLNTDGTLKKLISNGIHRYSIDAGSAYSPVTGTIEMRGERITLPITLKSVKASLSVKTTTSGSKIYINEDYKGTDSWLGELTPGTYLVEARKDGFRSVSKTVTLAKQQTESITLPALQQIFGSMMVDYEPVDADVYLDNTLIGKSPNVFNNLATGKHSIKISKAGYADYTGSVTIQENQQATVSGSLSKTDLQTMSDIDLQKNTNSRKVKVNTCDSKDILIGTVIYLYRNGQRVDGVVSDFEGDAYLSVQNGDVIKASHVGHISQQIKINDINALNDKLRIKLKKGSSKKTEYKIIGD